MKYTARPAGKKLAAARQTGLWERHPDVCECRKCRRAQAARARRNTPRYGQPDGGTPR